MIKYLLFRGIEEVVSGLIIQSSLQWLLMLLENVRMLVS